MSAHIIAQVWDSDITDEAELLVLLALADSCDDAGQCWTYVREIATKARMTRRGARKIVARLCARGIVQIDAQAARNGRNRYSIFPFAPTTQEKQL